MSTRPNITPPKFKQIQCVSVPNTISTQCNIFMYGLDEHGALWFKRECDDVWVLESEGIGAEEQDELS